MNPFSSLIALLVLYLIPSLGIASTTTHINLHATDTFLGIACVGIFALAYLLVMVEELVHLRKSKPVVLAAGIIWLIVAIICQNRGLPQVAQQAVRINILEYAELLLFLLVAMTYVNTLEERQVFEKMRIALVNRGLSYRQLYWISGFLAFFISPIADNLTTALLMCAIVMAVGADNPRFVSLACIGIVVAANAGGAFSPFGDITTLMVWQKGILPFQDFFKIFFPALVNYLVPAAIMHFAIPHAQPPSHNEQVTMKLGAKRVVVLFLLTIATAVAFHNYLHMPPVIGMMTGLGYLFIFSYYLKKSEEYTARQLKLKDRFQPFDIFNKIKRAEWDTLLFFYGVILCVGGLATIGYLELISSAMYEQLGSGLTNAHKATPANVVVGILSAIVDNIPIMFAILTMLPEMSEGQWLLVTLTTGVGGSMLSIGSAAGVALMGQSKGLYTFIGHLKWSWAILLGYAASIALHIWLNADLFFEPI